MYIRPAIGKAVMAALILTPFLHSQGTPPSGTDNAPDLPPPSEILDGWHRPFPRLEQRRTSASAPRRDFSGIWDPGPDLGVQVLGARNMPADGKPEHEPPYTALGLEALNRTKPAGTVRSVLPAESNDPVFHCDPQGVPREDLYELRVTQIFQTPKKLVLLYTYGRIWRVIWTDGRELPKNAEPRWFGYSVGKWVDDTTLLVDTRGIDERTWIDRAGRPHSADLHVQEKFHRIDRDHMELTVMIDDPKMYTKPWVALDKLRFDLRPDDFDIREMICAPSDFAEYNRLLGNPASNIDGR